MANEKCSECFFFILLSLCLCYRYTCNAMTQAHTQVQEKKRRSIFCLCLSRCVVCVNRDNVSTRRLSCVQPVFKLSKPWKHAELITWDSRRSGRPYFKNTSFLTTSFSGKWIYPIPNHPQVFWLPYVRSFKVCHNCKIILTYWLWCIVCIY